MAVIKIDNNIALEEDILLEKEKKQFNTHRHSKEFIRERSMKNQTSKLDEEPGLESDTQDPVDKLKDEKYWNDRVKQCETTFDIKELCREYMNMFFSQLDDCVKDAKEIATRWLVETQVFNYEKNPLMLWIKNMSDNIITINEDNCRAIQKLYANNIIDDKQLKNNQDLSNILYNKTLYKYNKNDIEFIIKTYKFLNPSNKYTVKNHLYNFKFLYDNKVATIVKEGNKQVPNVNYEKLRNFLVFSNPDTEKETQNNITLYTVDTVNNIKNKLSNIEQDDSHTGLTIDEREYDINGKVKTKSLNSIQSKSTSKKINLTDEEKNKYNSIINNTNLKIDEIPKFAQYLMSIK